MSGERLSTGDPDDPMLAVEALGHLRRVRLPADFAAAVVRRFFQGWSIAVDVVDGGEPARALGLGEGEWAIACEARTRVAQRLLRAQRRLPDRREPARTWHVFARHTLLLHPGDVGFLKSCLEREKPERLDADGLPQPWVPRRVERQVLALRDGERADVEVVRGPLPNAASPPGAGAADADRQGLVEEAFHELRALAGLVRLPLRVWLGERDKHGFVTGHLTKDEQGRPLRIVITLCPNADRAEIRATLLHELAHAVTPGADHGAAFKAALVDLAERAHGAPWFQEARARSGERYAEVDRWIASGVRAALQDGEVPRAQVPDDGQTARTVNRIRKLRALAAASPGTMEAVTATGLANDLVTRFGLAGYEVLIDAGLDDQMVDRWLQLDKGKVWKRALAHEVAAFSSVFSLAIASEARMHLFGKHRDIESAIYLYRMAERQIEQACERHLAAWRARPDRPTRAGAMVRERTSFCDSAVVAFAGKLHAIQEEERRAAAEQPRSADAQAFALARLDLERAEDFAREEHVKRGSGWSGGSSKHYRHSDAGHAAGLAIDVTRPADRRGGRLLGDGGCSKSLPDSSA